MDRILPPYPPDRSASAQRQLEKLGATVRTNTRVIDIDERSVRVVCGGIEETIPTRTVLWAAGVQASTFARSVAEATGRGRTASGVCWCGPT